MHLLLRRSHREHGLIFRSISYHLDARLDLSAEEAHLVKKHRLRRMVVYESADYTEHADAAYANFDVAANMRVFNPSLRDLSGGFGGNVRGIWHRIMMAFALRIRLVDLIAGQHIACADLPELVTAEKAITAACEYVAEHLDVALTVDGREELREF